MDKKINVYKNYILVLLAFGTNFCVENIQNDLTPATPGEFNSASGSTSFVTGYHIQKDRGILRFGNCSSFKDVKASDDFQEFEYVGEINGQNRFKVIRKTLFNGEEFIILDTTTCNTSDLLGNPFVFGTLIINLNESETTDRKNVLQIWKISKAGIEKQREVSLGKIPYITHVRFDDQKGQIVLRDNAEKYWKIKQFN